MTTLSQVLVKRHRGRVSIRFTETGVVAEVEVEDLPVIARNDGVAVIGVAESNPNPLALAA